MNLTMMESFVTFWHLVKQKYPHIKGMKDIASATLNSLSQQRGVQRLDH